MAISLYGRKLNPYCKFREPLGVKGVRQSVVITNNPSTTAQNQQLLVRFPNLGAHDVIVPGTARLAFKITLNSEDATRTVVQNLGRAIVKKATIKISCNEGMSMDDRDAYTVTMIFGRQHNRGRTPRHCQVWHRNTTWIRVSAGN